MSDVNYLASCDADVDVSDRMENEARQKLIKALASGSTIQHHGQDYRVIADTLYSSAAKLVPSSLQPWRPAHLNLETLNPSEWKIL